MNPAERNAQTRRYHERRPDTPRRVRHGVKLSGVLEFSSPLANAAHSVTLNPKSKLQNPNVALAERWLRLIEARIEPAVMTAGLEYARAGQIVNVEFRAGAIEARVQGRSSRPYQTILHVPSLTPGQWEPAIEAMAAEAVYVAKLLANELPAATDDLLASLELSLLPESADSLEFQCDCTEVHPCKHVAAVTYLVAERLAENPLLIFTLLGMPADRVLERLRRARTIQAHGVASAHADALIPESQVLPPPLEACLDEFWRGGTELAELENRPPPQHISHALLRRLGPSPMNGRFPLVGLLASVYDTVSAAATQLRDQTERDDDSGAAGRTSEISSPE